MHSRALTGKKKFITPKFGPLPSCATISSLGSNVADNLKFSGKIESFVILRIEGFGSNFKN